MDTESQLWLDKFLAYLADKRGYSAHTVSAYRRDLAHFVQYLSSERVVRQEIEKWADVDIQRVRTYVASRHRTGISGRSLQRTLSVLRVFFRYLASQGQIQTNPVQHARAPRTPRKLPSVLDVDQMDRLLAFEARNPLALRDRAIMELTYSSGLRLSELVSLDIANLDLSECLVDVTGKGDKERKTPVGRIACEVLLRWLEARSALAATDETALFIGRSGKRLTPRAIQYRVRHWARRLSIDQHVHPHMLRHAFASHLLESSGDLRAVQELLGHMDISTTQVYTHLDFQHLAQIYDNTHPRAKK